MSRIANIHQIFALGLIILIISQCLGLGKIFRAPLDKKRNMQMNWKVDYNTETVAFEVHIPSDFGWFAFGFSDRGEFFPADFCVLWQSTNGKIYFEDVFSDEEGVVHVDKQQDCNQFKIKRLRDVTKFAFTRRFDTCDPEDYLIEDGTTHVIWAIDDRPVYKLEGMNISVPSENSGIVTTQLLKNLHLHDELPNHVKSLEVRVDKVKVPDAPTTYWCKVFKLPERFKDKHHVYRYEAIVGSDVEDLIHHIEVFHCETAADKPMPFFEGSCFANDRPPETQVCKRVLAAWAMGAPPFTYPEEAGLPIGGEHFNPYLMLEVHYNNVGKVAGIVDSTGIRIHYSPKLKPWDASIMELGLEYIDKMAIPPQQSLFLLSGYCVSECTAVSLPPEGITIFGSQMHTHLTGLGVVTRHIRDGIEMNELNRDNHFTTHYQEVRRLKKPVKVLPGDALITTCFYNTMARENMTMGGFGLFEEMCVNYVHYFPATKLEVCKSAISDQALTTFFTYMNEWEGQDTSPAKGNVDNYNSIKWNKMRAQLLRDVYAESPLSMQCNMSSGNRFPGYWENTPVTTVLKPLPPPARDCDNLE